MNQGFLLPNRAAERGSSLRARLCVLCLILSALLLFASAVIAPLRLGWMALFNRLFAASERLNSYQYTYFSVPDGTALIAAWIMAGSVSLLAAAVILLSRGALPALIVAALLCGAQAYFGVALPYAVSIAVFLFLGITALSKMSRRAILPALTCAACVILITAVFFPGTNAAVEAASEAVRDRVGTAYAQQTMSGESELSDRMETRRENLRDIAQGAEDAQLTEAYRLVTVEEKQIALPHWIDYLRIALLCLLIPVLLGLPFLPFIWLNRQTRRTEEKLACLDDPDDRAAILGMFAIIIGYLDECSVGSRDSLYARRDVTDSRLTADYAEMYRQCATVWQKTAYSAHPPAAQDRAAVLRLLEETEKRLYDTAGRKQRFRMKYIACLHD